MTRRSPLVRAPLARPLKVLVAAFAFLVLGAAPAVAKPPAPSTTPTTYDVSYPQCGNALPSGNIDGGIVGVNGGRVYSANPCLGTEWSWAQQRTYPPALYANTGNPGPAYSSHWPTGQTTPQACDGTNSTACSYDYGWNAANDSLADAAAAIAAPTTSTWWLDVETTNSWETLESGYGQTASSRSNDAAALQGAADALAAAGVATVGFYSTSYQWSQITGGTGSRFATSPAWVAGTGSLSTAQANCRSTSFTGGPIRLAQWSKSGYDADYHC